MSELIVSQLAIYPVKSMRQVPLEKANIDMGGLKNDRRWMVVDSNGQMITQRQQSRLCLIQPELIDDGISLSTTGMNDLRVSIPKGGAVNKVTVWRDNCNAYDAGEEAGQWLSRFLGVECRLVYFPEDEIRIVDQTYAQKGDRTAFSDGFPMLLTSQASLDDLNARLSSSVPMARFRPNIVVSGCLPYAEDEWKRLKIGDFKLRVVKPCSRCVIPSIDIETAERTGEPTKTLSTYRRRDNKIFFGQNVVIDGEGEITTGMPVEILE
jgi:uncharacterized protein YcbX